MNVIGDMSQYAKFQTANAIGDLGKNVSSDSAAGLGMGMGAGYVMANQMGQMFNQPAQTNTSQPTPPPIVQYFFVINGQQSGPYTLDQIPQLIQQGTVQPNTLAWKAGMPNWLPASNIAELAAFFAQTPPPVPPQNE